MLHHQANEISLLFCRHLLSAQGFYKTVTMLSVGNNAVMDRVSLD